MKLICNNCYTGFLQKKLNMRYETPFVWNRIMPDSYIQLIENYDTMNFTNIKMFNCGDRFTEFRNNEDKSAFGMDIDNIITVYWWHYRYDANAKEPIINPPNVYYCKNYEYTLNKYITRLQRMLSTNHEPIFVYHSNTAQLNTTSLNIIDNEQDLIKLIQTTNRMNRKLVLITQYNQLTTYNSNNICVIYNPNILEEWDSMLNKHTDTILKFASSF